MNSYSIHGQLRFGQDNLDEALAFVKSRVSELSEPQLRNLPGTDQAGFWWAYFGATPQQWNALAPELTKMNVVPYLNEELDPTARADSVEKRYEKLLYIRNRTQLIRVIGAAMLIGAVAAAYLGGNGQLLSVVCLVGLALVVISSVILKYFEERNVR